MGFRDIHAFNLATLAKQAWRLIHHTHSLFYNVYKVRYFPSCSFLDAELGSNSYYVWHSLLAARELIRKSTKWRIGDSCKDLVTDPCWLPNPPRFLVDTPPSMMHASELINGVTRQWDRTIISKVFTLRTCQ